MNASELYALWRGSEHPWTRFTKPALFASLKYGMAPWPKQAPYRAPQHPWRREVSWAPRQGAALVLDLAGVASLELALALTSRRYRPVLAINSLSAEHEIIVMSEVLETIEAASAYPELFDLPASAPPAFILDSRRHQAGRASEGSFDNRGIVFTSDFPSGRYLRDHGIDRVLLVQEQRAVPEHDVRDVLCGWQHEGLGIDSVDLESGETTSNHALDCGSVAGRALDQFLKRLGSDRRSDGSFGYVVRPSHG